MTEHEHEAIKAARNAYRREWRKKNPDKVKAAQERYWLKRAQELSVEGSGDSCADENN